ncbi:MAG: hypothetical protein QG599_394 [Pseudomonadota bacterium]|nr:hypothetical protein [Pseudomonadota bacterium]
MEIMKKPSKLFIKIFRWCEVNSMDNTAMLQKENDMLKEQNGLLMEKIKCLDQELNVEKIDKIRLLDRIVMLENKIDIFNKKLDVARENRIKLLNEAQRATDRSSAAIERHNIISKMLNQEKAKMLSIFEENVTLKSELMKNNKELKDLKDAYRLAVQKIDEENLISLAINNELEYCYKEIERLKIIHAAIL